MKDLTKTSRIFYAFGFILGTTSLISIAVGPLRRMPDEALRLGMGYLCVIAGWVMQQLGDALSELPEDNPVRIRITGAKSWRNRVSLIGGGLMAAFFLIVTIRLLLK
jgi:hypothetical protein